jgi:RNA polymerase sigma-70 factor (ECF subfamily)
MGHQGRETIEQRQNDICFDVDRVIATLPEDLQELCEKLQSRMGSLREAVHLLQSLH